MSTAQKTTKTIVKKCSCTSPYQDEKYGPKMRVHNIGQGRKQDTCRCTVCGTKRDL